MLALMHTRLDASAVCFHLARVGFSGDLAEALAKEYELGRQILAMHLDPWALRAERKRARERRCNEDDEEYERVFGGPKPGKAKAAFLCGERVGKPGSEPK